jgi:hypothetical protein
MKIIAVLLAAGLLSAPRAVEAGEVWLSGVDPVVAHDRNPNAPDSDFIALFRPDAPWEKAAHHVQIFKVSTQFLQRASDDQLRAVIENLRARHIALGLEAEILATSVKCGNGMPGFTTTNVIQKAVDHVVRLGGRIDYVAFDEPVTWGQVTRGQHPCGYNVEDLVRNIAPNVQTIRRAFANVVFGDIEPVSDKTFGRLDVILAFAREFQKQTGSRIAFLQADLIWQNRWEPQLVEWRARLSAAGIRYGVIFDGDPSDKTDIAWTTHAVQRYRQVMSNPQVAPEEAVIQSWQPRPTRFLPEDLPGTLTSVVVDALAGRDR